MLLDLLGEGKKTDIDQEFTFIILIIPVLFLNTKCFLSVVFFKMFPNALFFSFIKLYSNGS